MDDYQTQRDKRLKEKKSGTPFGHLNTKSIRIKQAKAEAASKNLQHQGTESSKNH